VKLKLVCRDPLASPREIMLDRFPIELGRGENSGVRLDDRWLSRRHCELNEIEGEVHVRDLGSRHGTFVNGKQVVEATIRTGDVLCIGLSHFTVACEQDLPADALHIHDSSELVMA
jgi:pSer/pThr/pTyr-binding forkhead associated (FHA) protein